MYDKRDRYFEDAFQKVSRQIVDMLVEKKIGKLIVGYNAGWKQESGMGKRNNQKFVQMPFARLASYLKYKSEMVGINKFTYGRTKESSLSSSSKVLLMFADWFKSQCITFTCITFFVLNEVNTNHFALVS